MCLMYEGMCVILNNNLGKKILLVVCFILIFIGAYLLQQQSVEFEKVYNEQLQTLNIAESSVSRVSQENENMSYEDRVDFNQKLLDKAQVVADEIVASQENIGRMFYELEKRKVSSDDTYPLIWAEEDKLTELFGNIPEICKVWAVTNYDNDSFEKFKWHAHVGKVVSGGSVGIFFTLDDGDGTIIKYVYGDYNGYSGKIENANICNVGYKGDYFYMMEYDTLTPEEEVADYDLGTDEEFAASMQEIMDAPIWDGWTGDPMSDEDFDEYGDMLDARDEAREENGEEVF